MTESLLNGFSCFSNVFLRYSKAASATDRVELIYFSPSPKRVRAPFLATKLQFGVTAMTPNPCTEMTRECKSCHIDTEIESESEAS